jgi:para-nitrobenzyl esterase
MYRFDWSSPDPLIGAGHSVELPFLLGDVAAWDGAPMLGGGSDEALAVLGPLMRRRWAGFARGGVASLPGETLVIG